MQYLDTYALMEIKNESPSYARVTNFSFLVSDMTLIEFHAVLLRDKDQSEADYWVRKFLPFVETTSLEEKLEANRFKRKNKGLNLSFYDAVGYIHSLQNHGQFVTGDKAFEKLPHVNYIK